MIKRDIVTLLFPSFIFVAVVIAAFWSSHTIRQYAIDDGSQQKFDGFVTNVQTGKFQLTTDKWLEGMRHERALAEAYRKAGLGMANMMEIIGLATLAGFLLQIAAVFSASKKLKKS